MAHSQLCREKLQNLGPFQISPYLHHLLFNCILYHILSYKPLNISVFQSSISHYSKLLNLKRLLWESLIWGQTQQKGTERGNLLLVTGIRGEGRSCRTEPLICGIGSWLHADNVRIQFNGRSASYCQRTDRCGKIPTHFWCPSIQSVEE